jgi:hypothetical protein
MRSVLRVGGPACWTMWNDRIEGHELGAYVALFRSFVTEHGIVYAARAV